jgi:hypothetical protein
MATTSRSGLELLRLSELLVLIKRTAERARDRRVLNPREAMVPDEVKNAEVLYARASAWPLGGHCGVRSPSGESLATWKLPFSPCTMRYAQGCTAALAVNEKNPTPTSNHI